MGLCASTNTEGSVVEKKTDLAIQRQMKAEQKKEHASVKLLMLGAGDSGKTTLRKQMRQIYGAGYTQESLEEHRSVIVENLIEGARDILKFIENEEGLYLSNDESKAAAKTIMTAEDSPSALTPEVAEALKTLWEKDEAYQKAYNDSAKYHLQDCWTAFMKSALNFPDWGGPEYVPTVDEVIRARIRTSGITEETFTIEGVVFKLFDAGGQRAERRKWIHCFDNVTAVIFVAALSEYDQSLFETNDKNRLEEATELFSDVCNSPWFQGTPIMLFLNKRDVLEDKLTKKNIPLNVSGLFPSAPDTFDVDEAIGWITQQFLDKKQDGDKDIYVHVTTAVDSENVHAVFDTCKNIILRSNLEATGFMPSESV